MFADLVGFTAWSSVREPTQVFTLLETIYRAYDAIARRRRVFKVETVGDCYVAVAGLPEARKDHAVVMVKFANECMRRTREVTKQLDVLLGPDTADL
jgi:class 3 adenylate cyclase